MIPECEYYMQSTFSLNISLESLISRFGRNWYFLIRVLDKVVSLCGGILCKRYLLLRANSPIQLSEMLALHRYIVIYHEWGTDGNLSYVPWMKGKVSWNVCTMYIFSSSSLSLSSVWLYLCKLNKCLVST